MSFLIALAVLSGPRAFAADDVEATKHNLSTTGTGTNHLSAAPGGDAEKDQICVFCHTPHHGDTTVGVALWNRGITTTGYTMYDSSTIDMTIAAQPQGVSLACLSCHDGTIAFDALLNGPGSGDYNGNAWSRGWTFAGANKMTTTSKAGYLSKDLSNDHPVSVTYDITADTAFIAQATVETTGGLKFFNNATGTATDQVECATCHNPHSAEFPPFLRKSNAGSALCLTCHIK